MILKVMCEEVEHGHLMLHYYSQREGLYPIVIGLVEAVGLELFGQKVDLTVVSRTQEETAAKIIQHHTVFKVELENTGDTVALVGGMSAPPSPTTSERDTPDGRDAHNSVLKADDFCSAFPYHLVFDEDLCIRQCGDNIRRITHVSVRDGTPFRLVGRIVQPVMDLTLDNIFKFINAVFLVAIFRQPSEGDRPFVLKGQMMWMRKAHMMLFIGSPRLTSLNELMEMKVYLADIPLYDCTRELVLLNQQRIAEIDVAKKLDETTTALQKTSLALEEEKRKTEDLLHEMLPKKVACQLTHGGTVAAEKFDCVTILFSDIVTFTNIATACTPMDIVNMLNDLFHRFDTHTNTHDVYKVETIGDAYMGVAGVPEAQEDHAERVADFAMGMIVETSHVNSPATGLPLQIRVGIHSGPVVAGVVGKKMPRYCLFGDTVNTASRMESHGVPGRVHVSQVTFSKLYDYGYVFKQRGEVEVKGKGKMVTYFLVGSQDQTLPQPSDDVTHLPDIVRADPIRRVRRTSTSASSRVGIGLFEKSSSQALTADAVNLPADASQDWSTQPPAEQPVAADSDGASVKENGRVHDLNSNSQPTNISGPRGSPLNNNSQKEKQSLRFKEDTDAIPANVVRVSGVHSQRSCLDITPTPALSNPANGGHSDTKGHGKKSRKKRNNNSNFCVVG
ncbi:hypothetical protein ACOMHN_024354 [Nucella lapillus]